ncbi:hypothetical protein ACFPA8_10530 [Streptomyces ovatisporus]|uniref:Uncharacterized protein n=1 Tax=Streptomyces ovatisporus TaxID=1128682 RepID=A0ABV9A530_9ACTN
MSRRGMVMGVTTEAGWALLEVRAQHWADGKSSSTLRWRGFPTIYPDFGEAVSWAHSGSAVFGTPSERRVAHPAVENAVVVIEPPSLWMVFPIPAGVDRRSFSERIYRAAPDDWMLRVLLP